MPKTYYLSNSYINASMRATPYTSPASVYLALFTSSPTPGGGGTEVSAGGYTRQAVTWSVPSSGVSANTTDIVFSTASQVWGTVVSFGVYDNPVAGNLLYYSNLNASRLVQVNDQVKFPTGQLQVTED